MIVAGAAEVAASIRILAFVIVNARTSLLCDALTLSFEVFRQCAEKFLDGILSMPDSIS